MFDFIKKRKSKKLVDLIESLGYDAHESIACPGSYCVRFGPTHIFVVCVQTFGYKAYYYRNMADNLEPTIFEYADIEFIKDIIISIEEFELKQEAVLILRK